jgi:hypothetical protein
VFHYYWLTNAHSYAGNKIKFSEAFRDDEENEHPVRGTYYPINMGFTRSYTKESRDMEGNRVCRVIPERCLVLDPFAPRMLREEVRRWARANDLYPEIYSTQEAINDHPWDATHYNIPQHGSVHVEDFLQHGPMPASSFEGLSFFPPRPSDTIRPVRPLKPSLRDRRDQPVQPEKDVFCEEVPIEFQCSAPHTMLWY